MKNIQKAWDDSIAAIAMWHLTPNKESLLAKLDALSQFSECDFVQAFVEGKIGEGDETLEEFLNNAADHIEACSRMLQHYEQTYVY